MASKNSGKRGAKQVKEFEPQNNLETTPRNCAACSEPDWKEKQVECGKCERWFHLSCAGVNESIEQRSFACKDCSTHTQQLTSSALSCKSTTSSAKARLAELELKRLEDEKKLNVSLLNERLQKEKDIQQKENKQERERCEKELKEKERLEKEFLTKWYEVMRSMAEEDDGGSCRSFHTNRSSANKVKQWLNVQVLPTSEVVSGENQNPTIIPSNTKPTTVLQSPVGTSRPIPEPNTTQVIPQMTSSEQQKQVQMLPMRASVVTQRFAKPLIASSTPILQQSGQPAAQRQQFEFQHITQAHPPSHARFQEIPKVRPGEVRPTEVGSQPLHDIACQNERKSA